MRAQTTFGRLIVTAVIAALAVACGAGQRDREADSIDSVETGVTSEAMTLAACANGSAGQAFTRGLVGCPGSVAWTNRGALCGSGFHVASALDWEMARGGLAPAHDYWTNDSLGMAGQAPGSCSARLEGSACPANAPAHVCTRAGTDTEGNHCSATMCGLESTQYQYFGGCGVPDITAGTLCAPNGCADGTIDDQFLGGVIGCAGSVTFANRASLCAPGYRVATSNDWRTGQHMGPPAHNYWTDEELRYNGSATKCSVDFAGSACPAGQPMRICTPGLTDSEGNTCTWGNCSSSFDSSDSYYGGCYGNPTAGTLCVPAIDPANTCAPIRQPSDATTRLSLVGWITRRQSATDGCPAIPLGSRGASASGIDSATWLDIMQLKYRALYTEYSFDDELRHYIVPGITERMLSGADPFCVYRIYDGVNGVTDQVPAGASGIPFAPWSSTGEVRAYCMPPVLEIEPCVKVNEDKCGGQDDIGCPKCFSVETPE